MSQSSGLVVGSLAGFAVVVEMMKTQVSMVWGFNKSGVLCLFGASRDFGLRVRWLHVSRDEALRST